MHDATYELAGRRYKVEFVRMTGSSNGHCTNPNMPRRRIRLHARTVRTRRLMADIIHECLHACAWDMSEEWVHSTSADLAKVLWSQGFQVPIE